MSMPKKGSRRLVVEGAPFRWRVRARPTYSQGLGWSPLTVGVEAEPGGVVLVLVFGAARPDNWVGEPASIATPAAVEDGIRRALDAGWIPDQPGAPTFFEMATGRLAASMPRPSARQGGEAG